MKHNILKRTLAGVLAILCVAGTLPANVDGGGLFDSTAIVAKALPATSGSCGASGNENGVTWSANGSTLTISGTGAMADYDTQQSDQPWNDYNNTTSIQTVIIEECVTSIGNYAFLDFKGITTVSFPASITKIGDYAFKGCDNLTTATFTPGAPNSTLNIGTCSFYTPLTTIAFGTGYTKLYIADGNGEIKAGNTLLMLNGLQAKWKAEPVTYMDWDDTNKTLVEKSGDNACKVYTPVTSSTSAVTWGNTDTPTWYVVSGADVTISERITVTGTVNLILKDGAKLTASNGIKVPENATLNIYGQSEGTGELVATTSVGNYAGIGGNNEQAGGAITINGGTVTATGGFNGAGIGGGDSKAGGTVTINGGTVTANGDNGAGIGGGNLGAGGSITINGGTVTATSGIGGAGIGGGYGGAGGTVKINGGTVTATGGTQGAGIGGGYYRAGGTVTISGGTVTATGGENAAGIGRGNGASVDGTVEIENSDLTVKAGADASSAVTVTDYTTNHTQRYVKIGYPEVTADSPLVLKEGESLTVNSEVHVFNGGAASFEAGSVFELKKNGENWEVKCGNSTPFTLPISENTAGTVLFTLNGNSLTAVENKVYTSAFNSYNIGDVIAVGASFDGEAGMYFQGADGTSYKKLDNNEKYEITTQGLMHNGTPVVKFAGTNNAFVFERFSENKWYFKQTQVSLPGTITVDDGITVKQGEATLSPTDHKIENVEGDVVFTSTKPFAVKIGTKQTLAALVGDTYTYTHTMIGDVKAIIAAVEVDNNGTKSYYNNLKDAVDYSLNDAVITLLDDVTETAAITVTGKTITIKGEEGKAHTVTANVVDLIRAGAGGIITLGEGLTINNGNSILWAYSGGKITVNGATLNCNNSPNTCAFAENEGSEIVVNSGSINQTGNDHVTLSIAESATAEITGGEVTNDSSTTIVAKKGGTITISGGTVSTTAQDFCTAYTNGNGSKITLNGGTITAQGNSGLIATANSTVEVISGTITAPIYSVLAHEGNATAIIRGGDIIGGAGAGSTNNGANNTLTISGGKINGQVSIASGKGSATISGGVFSTNPKKDGVTIENGKSVLALTDSIFKFGVAETSMNPNINAVGNGKTYNGTSGVDLEVAGLSKTVSINETVYTIAYTYQWAKKNGESFENISGATSASYQTGVNAADSGEYKCVVTSGEFTAEPTKEVTISKANPTATAPTGLTATYGQTLADVALTNPSGNTPGTWAWVDAGTTSVGNAGSQTFNANFTPTDSANYNSIENVVVTITVNQAPSLKSAPTAKNPIYYTSPVQLINAGEVEDGCTIEYSLGTDSAADEKWVTDASTLTADKAGTYYVWYKVKGTENYADFDATTPITVTVAQGSVDPTWTLIMDSYEYDGTAHEPTIEGKVHGDLTYQYYNVDTDEVLTKAPSAVGNYRVTVTSSASENYTAVVRQAAYSITAPASTIVVRARNAYFTGLMNLVIKFKLPESVTSDSKAYVEYSWTEGTEKRTEKKLISELPTGTVGTDKVYVVENPVYAPEMENKVTYKFFDGSGKQINMTNTDMTEMYKDGYQFSLRDYLDLAMANGNDDMKALADAAYDYGIASQINFKYGDYQNLKVSDKVKAVKLSDLEQYKLTESGTLPEIIKNVKYSVEFAMDNTLRVKFNFKSAPTAEQLKSLTCTIDGKAAELEKLGDTQYALVVRNIAAPQIDTAHTFVISDGKNTYTTVRSALSYAYSAIEANSNPTLVDLAKAMFLYNQAANEKFAE